MSNIVSTLTADNLTAIAGVTTKFCRADTDRAFALHEFMRIVGDAPTYEQWALARDAGIKGYLATKPQANEEAQNKFWSRFVQSLKDYVNESGFEMKFPSKPKAETPAAQAMAAKRANEFKGKTAAELAPIVQTLAQTVASTPTADNAAALAKATAAMDAAKKATEKELAKAANDATKKRRDTVAAYVKACPAHVLALFECLMDATHDSCAPDVQAKATATLMAAMAKPAKAPAKPAKAKRAA